MTRVPRIVLGPAALMLAQGIIGAEAKSPTSCDKLGDVVAALQGGGAADNLCKGLRKTLEDTVSYVTIVPTQTPDVIVPVTKADCGPTPQPPTREPPTKLAAGDSSSNKVEAPKSGVDTAALQAQKARLQADIDEKRAKIASLQQDKAGKPEDVAKKVAKLAEDISEKVKELERISRLLSGGVNVPRAVGLPSLGGVGVPSQPQSGARVRLGGTLWEAVKKLVPGSGAGALDIELDSILKDLTTGLAGLSLPAVGGNAPRDLTNFEKSFGKSVGLKIADGKLSVGGEQDVAKIVQAQTAAVADEIRQLVAQLMVSGPGIQGRGISPPSFKDGKLTQEFSVGKGVKISDGTISGITDTKALEDLLGQIANAMKDVGPRGLSPPSFKDGKLTQEFSFGREFKLDDKIISDLVAQLQALLPGGGKINAPRGISPPTFKDGKLTQEFSLEKGVRLDDKAISDLITQLQSPRPDTRTIQEAIAQIGKGQPDSSAIQGVITRLAGIPAAAQPVQDAIRTAIAQFGQLRPDDKTIQEQIAKIKLPEIPKPGPAPGLPSVPSFPAVGLPSLPSVQDQVAKIKLPQLGGSGGQPPSNDNKAVQDQVDKAKSGISQLNGPAFDPNAIQDLINTASKVGSGSGSTATDAIAKQMAAAQDALAKQIQEQTDRLRESAKQLTKAITLPRSLFNVKDSSDPAKGKLDKSITLQQSAKLDELVQSTIARLQAAVEGVIGSVGAGRLTPVNLSLLGVGKKEPRQLPVALGRFSAPQVQDACACLPPLPGKVEIKAVFAPAQPAATKTVCVVG